MPWFPATTLASRSLNGAPTVPLGSGLLAINGVNLAGTLESVVDKIASTPTIVSDVLAHVEIGTVTTCMGGGASVIEQNITLRNPHVGAGSAGQCGVVPPGWPHATAINPDSGTVKRTVSSSDLRNGLVCYFNFVDGLADISGNSNTATASGGAISTAGKDMRSNTGFALPTASAKIAVPGCAAARTIAMWALINDALFDTNTDLGTCPVNLPAHAGAVRGVWIFYAGVIDSAGEDLL